MASFLALVGVLVGAFASRGIASPLLTAATWVVAEALLARWPFGGFPWAQVGLALHDIHVARALAGVGGVLLVSFATVALAGFLVDLATALSDRERRDAVLAGIGVVVVLVATIGGVRLPLLAGTEPGSSTSRCSRATIRSCHSPVSASNSSPTTISRSAAKLRGDYDLIVFPEGALDSDPEQDPKLREQLTDIAKKHDAAVLVNARVPVDRDRYADGLDDRIYNANLLYEPDGTLQGEYAKQHLVPFGEYVPLRGVARQPRRTPHQRAVRLHARARHRRVRREGHAGR